MSTGAQSQVGRGGPALALQKPAAHVGLQGTRDCGSHQPAPLVSDTTVGAS